jgi:hypothetical protein
VTNNNTPDNNGVRSTSVSVTLNAKSLGVDAFIKLEETREFPELVTPADAIIVREDIAAILAEQAIAIIGDTAKTVKAAAAATPQGHVSVHQVNPQMPAGQAAGQPAPAQAGPAQVAAVANGAAFQTEWRSVASKFGDGELRYIATSSYSSDQLENDVNQWLLGKGLNPGCFKVWDNRPGPRGLEAGVPNGAVAAVKVSKDLMEAVPDDFQKIPAARVKFNSNGSLYVWFTKEFEAFLKYGGAALFSLNAQGQAAPAAQGEGSPF